ncbi:ATP-dependent DNA helicase [Rossellomorea vietnamensis]|uniref:helicase C-terminal domain-containing protein n=1 Tax=Rossellomorea vietnamensis TaxID=218284 RepID=UPI001CC9303B|nr:helicase C-terminal domain-containing protein [Rossellomorea vietnamensis]MCA0150132.1 ATP-dependent DNA helicase [Rossellomorea vietnamensis]
MKKTMKVSIRELVEFVYKEGSIDLRFQSRSSMLIGTRLHQKWQKQYKEGDEKEVFLKGEKEAGGLVYHLEGRCDGIHYDDGEVTVEEIKSTAKSLDLIEGGSRVHWAQGECYAYLLAKEKELSHVSVQLTYIEVETERTKSFMHTYSIEELERIVKETLIAYTPFATVILTNEESKLKSVPGLTFPYPSYRKGQKKLAGAVYKTVTESKSLYANAPTGTGKTISTLFPAIKAMAEGNSKWYYVTAKTITRTVAEEALLLLENKGLAHRTVTITAKDKICFKEETICQKEYCEFANGYYDRINGALIDILTQETIITRPIIESYASKHRVCPFEYSIDLSYLVDGVICDYNYIFDPRVSLKRMSDESKKKTNLLIDEAHNLVGRGREMYSAALTKSAFLQIKKRHPDHEGLKQAITAVNKQFLRLKKEEDADTRVELDGSFVETIAGFIEIAEKCLGEMGREWSEEFMQLYFDSISFVRISNLYSEEHRFVIGRSSQDVEVKLYCIDPSKLIKQVTRPYQSSVFFSATLLPFSYYFQQLGGSEEDYRFLIPSPFQHNQWQVGIHPISTRFRDRERTLPIIIRSIEETFNGYKGNYLIFFSSYSYMQKAYDRMNKKSMDAVVLIQEPNMSEREREEFLREFRSDREQPVIGLAVLGGIFSEGIDLKGDRLKGVIVVGVGLPQPTDEQEIIKDYFNDMGMNGYDYAYVYPGLNKVFQSGGRLIRSEEDKGVLKLIDDRYLTPKYQALLLDEWKKLRIIT